MQRHLQEKATDENLASVLDRRCRLALLIVALLVLFNEAIVQPSLIRMTTDAPLINVAGRQRMLSQRLAKAALATERESFPAGTDSLVELEAVLRDWSISQQRLATGRGSGSTTSANSTMVAREFERVAPVFSRMRLAAEGIVNEASLPTSNRDAIRKSLCVIMQNENEYLDVMEKIVGIYAYESRERVNKLRLIGMVVTVLILVALLAIGHWIIGPAISMIRLQVEELRAAREDLENRVRDRTRQYEAARESHRAIVEQLGHVDRTTIIGEMASSLAHELNQPLGAIANYAEGCLIILKSQSPSLAEIRSAIERLLEATLRAGRIIGQVRRFVMRRGPQREWFEPNRSVSEVVEMLDSEAKRARITVIAELASELPNLWADATQIQQVLINLLRNAFDSLRQSQVLDPTVIIRTKRSDSGNVSFEVEDNGEGIEESDLAKVFDAYYSTRAEGMGMGLAICRSIIEAHQGQLRVNSERRVRTVFQFVLPGSGGDDAESDGLHRRR